MKYLLLLTSILAVALLSITCKTVTENDPDRKILGEQYAKEVLTEALKEPRNKKFPELDKQQIIDSISAIAIAEPILFKTFGKSLITEQKPYEIYHIENYWILMGTLPANSRGGTFTIILNDSTSEVLRLVHYQ